MQFSNQMTKSLSFLLLLVLTSCGVFKSHIPQPKNEFRGVWVATVVNIDWPKSGHDAIEKQKTDFIQLLDFYQELNFNAVIVQIRAAGDAFYPSELVPWSRFLTGTEGKAPSTYYDPLEWMIQEAHKRGFEFHAWLNPYRATFNEDIEVLSEKHDYNLHPDWMIKYGTKYYYNPGAPEVRQHLLNVVDEVVVGYDVDAIHFDDYFYPYKIKGEIFNDSTAFTTHALPDQSLEDWRRSNVDSLVKNVHESIKKRKPWVHFGISPFGVWKNKSTDPKGSDTQAGQTTYEDLYADPMTWMKNGWIDYLVPQVYWSMELPVASHRTIVDWWSKNISNTNLYIGNGTYKIKNNSDIAWDKKKELPQQILHARQNKKVQGNVFFSAKSLMHQNEDVVKYLKRKYYSTLALPPTSHLISDKIGVNAKLTHFQENNGVLQFDFRFDTPNDIGYALIYASKNSGRLSINESKQLLAKVYIKNENQFSFDKTKLKGKKHIAITFIDKFGIESDPFVLHLNQTNRYDTKK